MIDERNGRMLSDKEAEAELKAEKERRSLSWKLCIYPGLGSALILSGRWLLPAPRPTEFFDTLLAACLSGIVVLCARALDGPVRLRVKRRNDAAPSAAAGAIMLWLGCFASLDGAFLIAGFANDAGTWAKVVSAQGGAGGSAAKRPGAKVVVTATAGDAS